MKSNIENAIIFWAYVVKIMVLRFLKKLNFENAKNIVVFEVQIFAFRLDEIEQWLLMIPHPLLSTNPVVNVLKD